MYIYKYIYIFNLQTYIFVEQDTVHLWGQQSLGFHYNPSISFFQTHPKTHKFDAWIYIHALAHTHAHSASPVGILLYVIIRGGCTIKQAGVHGLALLASSEHP